VLFENHGHGLQNITKASGSNLVAIFLELSFWTMTTTAYSIAQGQCVGLADAFSGHLHPDRYEYPMLYKTMSDKGFKDVTAEVGLRRRDGAGAGFADLNRDLFPDVFFVNSRDTTTIMRT
jgi:hypothetical protein